VTAAGANLPRVEVASPDELRAWLAAHHRTAGSVWLVTHEKASGAPHLPYDTVVETLIAFGWIDSLPRKLDARRSMLLISPRKPRSAWSAANKARVVRLEAEGRMAEAGRAAVAAAQADGSWRLLDAVETLETPPDLAAALAAVPPAAETFAAFPRSTRRGILEWIAQAKRPETRAGRIAETARKAQAGERANQFQRRP
jgi:uncharacterized protein YdeI (YjbR/CyaY-like superfamily)